MTILRRSALAMLSILGLFAFAEGALRVMDGNALAQLDIFTLASGHLRLLPNEVVRLRRVVGGPYEVHTGEGGRRLPIGRDTLIVGDSQVLGLGVDDGEAFAAQLGWHNGGVPGHGVGDALQHARELIPTLHPARVVVVLNQANDWPEAMTPAAERYVVANGWLGARANAGTPLARFWASPLSASHLGQLGFMLALGVPPKPPEPLAPDVVATTTRAFFAGVLALQEAFPTIAVVTVFLPADAATSEARAQVSPLKIPGRPWEDTTLRDAVATVFADVVLVDLSPSLRAPENFLPGDYHLSAEGHRSVAERLGAML